MKQNGKCLCGKIKYQIKGEFNTISHCHCESCRRANSSPFVTWGSINKTQFSLISGEDCLKKYESSKGNFRIFCKNCGSQLFGEYKDDPNITYVSISSLESTPIPLPDRHYSYEEKVEWFKFQDDLPKFREKSTQEV